MIKFSFQKPVLEKELDDHVGALINYPFIIRKDNQKQLYASIKVQVTSNSGIDRNISNIELIEIVFSNTKYYLERGQYYRKIDDRNFILMFWSEFKIIEDLDERVPIDQIDGFTIEIKK
ncbi:MAG: hypothetical protein R2787_14415 [Saprospiraceae bacterium]